MTTKNRICDMMTNTTDSFPARPQRPHSLTPVRVDEPVGPKRPCSRALPGRRLIPWALALGLLACVDVTAAEGGKVGYVDMEKVFLGFYKTATSDAAFKKQKDVYNEHAAEMAEEIEALKRQRDELQERSLNIALADEVRAQARKDAEEKDSLYREKKNEIKDFVRNKDKELGKRYLDLRAELVKEISAFVKVYAKEKGFDLVLDTSGLTRNFIPVVVYFPEESDVTEDVLAELNRGHEEEVAKAKEAMKEEGGEKTPKPEGAADE